MWKYQIVYLYFSSRSVDCAVISWKFQLWQRERGGDKLFNSLLTELERHEGIIMLATNRPLDLDEAMHRRITYVLEFLPEHNPLQMLWHFKAVQQNVKAIVKFAENNLVGGQCLFVMKWFVKDP
jgi:SpoVK/Ycf46/Vps4 family AAA+-type ATPase